MKTCKILGLSLAMAASVPLNAQNIYDMEQVSSGDLNGTARYVGMGGAMNALGADMSTMSTNPAGTGLYRRSDFAVSVSVVNNPNGEKFDGHDKSVFSFDNVGFVIACPTPRSGSLKFINFGFTYRKYKNFNQNFSATDNNLNGLSQNGQLADLNQYFGYTKSDMVGNSAASPLCLAAYNAYPDRETGLIGVETVNGEDVWGYWGNDASEFYKAQWGSTQEYDFNVSFNLNHQVYLGFTLGAYYANYHSYSEYAEYYWDDKDIFQQDFNLGCDRRIYGGGMDAKFGAIVRPFENSPFRIGLALSSPTFYWLKTESEFGYDRWNTPGTLEYNVRTPWKLNLSLGHTVGNFLALGAEYEFAGYKSMRLAYDNGYDAYDGWNELAEDKAMKDEVKKNINGTHTLRLGAEVKVAEGLSLRAGYNYVSSPFKKHAFRNEYINSLSCDYSTGTDYMNKSDINRFTLGLGYRGQHWYGDFAYQYSQQTGDFYAFDDQYYSGENAYQAVLKPTEVKLNRSQFLFTLGYKF